MMKFFTMCLIIASMHTLLYTCRGLQLSMVASSRSAPSRPRNKQTTRIKRNIPFSTRSSIATGEKNKFSSVPSTLISQLACMALKRRLKSQDSHVSCDLTTDPNTILFGRIGPVTVKGRSWESPLGLSCGAIEATVAECVLDMGKVFSKQKLVLKTPAEGRAMVALSATDFGNFITHPLMKPPSPPQIRSTHAADNNKNILVFLRKDVSIDPSSGQVTFYGTYGGSKWKFILQRTISSINNGGKALIQATLVEPSSSKDRIQDTDIIKKGLTETTSKFFNEMIFELDGIFLSFDDMMLTEKGTKPSVMLSLKIKVKKFPSSGLQF